MVWLRWVDSAALFPERRWVDETELDSCGDETLCETAGFLVRENDHSLYVALNVSPEEIGSVMQIPRADVLERRDLFKAAA